MYVSSDDYTVHTCLWGLHVSFCLLLCTSPGSGSHKGLLWRRTEWSVEGEGLLVHPSAAHMMAATYNTYVHATYCKRQAYTKTPSSKNSIRMYLHTHTQEHPKHWPHTWLTLPTAYSHCSIGHSCHSPCPNFLHACTVIQFLTHRFAHMNTCMCNTTTPSDTQLNNSSTGLPWVHKSIPTTTSETTTTIQLYSESSLHNKYYS